MEQFKFDEITVTRHYSMGALKNRAHRQKKISKRRRCATVNSHDSFLSSKSIEIDKKSKRRMSFKQYNISNCIHIRHIVPKSLSTNNIFSNGINRASIIFRRSYRAIQKSLVKSDKQIHRTVSDRRTDFLSTQSFSNHNTIIDNCQDNNG